MTQKKTLLQLNDIKKERCKRSLAYFIQEAWPIIEPGEYMHNWHIDAICEHLQAVANGDIKRLIINIPPRCMKSTIVSVLYPAWDWIQNPQRRFLYSSYALSLSIRDAQKAKRVIESAWFQNNWGDIVHIREDQNAKSYYENTRSGARLSISVGSAATGHGGDVVCVDDPHNAQEAESPIVRQAALDWWSETMTSRLNNPKTGAFIVVMQRLHEKDLTGFLLDQGGYEHLCLPLEYDKRRIITHIKWKDQQGQEHTEWKDPRSQEGELLWPERINDYTLSLLKKASGPYAYAAQYQQLPSPSGGGIIKKEWFRYYKTDTIDDHTVYYLSTPEGVKPVLASTCRHFITVDLATSLKELADYTVIATWAQTQENDLILVDILRERMQAHEQQESIRSKFFAFDAEFIDVEASGFQLTICQQLIRSGMPVREYRPVRDKVSRARTASIRYSAGAIYHPLGASWLHEYEAELLGFPQGDHDDQVDVTSRAAEIVIGESQPNIRSLDTETDEEKELAKIAAKEGSEQDKYIYTPWFGTSEEGEWEDGEEIDISTYGVRI